jgi:hypothetical protein
LKLTAQAVPVHKHHKFIKLIGIFLFIIGVTMAFFTGQTTPSNYTIAAGCLMYLAVKIAEWWGKN